MDPSSSSARGAPSGQAGFSLLEVMIAAVLLLIVFSGLAQYVYRGRTQIGYEEDRRRATAIAEARLEGLRRDYRFDRLPALNGTDTTYVSDGRQYLVSHEVATGVPEPQAATISLTVTWNASVSGARVARRLVATTILARSLPVP